jgi:hypothetical protein
VKVSEVTNGKARQRLTPRTGNDECRWIWRKPGARRGRSKA